MFRHFANASMRSKCARADDTLIARSLFLYNKVSLLQRYSMMTFNPMREKFWKYNENQREREREREREK